MPSVDLNPLLIEPLEGRHLLTVPPAGSSWVPFAQLTAQDVAANQFPNLNGSGIGVAIIDRGINTTAPNSASKIVYTYNFRDNNTNGGDDYGHGTGVAGIIAADPYNYGGYNQGIAPAVKIIDLKQESSAGIKQALDWVIANHAQYNIQVVNITDFVTDVLPGAWNPEIYNPELQQLHDLGIFMSTPVGNGEIQFGPNAPIAYPALSPYVMGVGGFDLNSQMWADSRRGPGLDILAPSFDVTMPWYIRNKNSVGYDQYDDNYDGQPVLVNYAQGTSWGSAYVAGAAVLIKQINPNITPDQVDQILIDSGTPTADPENPGVFYPRLNVEKAIQLAYQRYGSTPALPVTATGPMILGTTVNTTKLAGSESSNQVAINPTNPNNIVMVSESSENAGSSIPLSRSTDGGHTWTTQQIGWEDGQNLGNARPDAHLAFDSFGNLYVTYEVGGNPGEIRVVVLRSTDGGANFTSLGYAASGTTFDPDAPYIATGPDAVNPALQHVWVTFTDYNSNRVMISGGTSSGSGQFSGWSTPHAVNQSFGTYSTVAVGPQGQVAVSWQSVDSGGFVPNSLKTNVDTTGTGNSFSADRLMATTNVGGFYNIPAQPDRSIDAEGRIAFDRSGGATNGRLYLVYTDQASATGNNTDIFLRYSDNFGVSWSAPLRVNDDATQNSQFLPAIAVDPTSGNVGLAWLDARNSPSNTGVELFTTVSLDHGASVQPNAQVASALSFQAGADPNSNDLDFGDYGGLAFYGGKLVPVWSDNTNSTGDNPAGAGQSLDVYTNVITINTSPPPAVVSTLYDPVANALKITFSTSVRNSFDATDVSLVDLSTSPNPTTITIPAGAITYDTVSNTASISFAGQPGGKLADGHYAVMLNAAGITADSNGKPLGSNYGFDFIAFTPAAPVARATSGTTMHLTLPATLAATNGYAIQRAIGNGPFTTIANAATNTFDDSGLTPGVIYRYRIAASSGATLSSFSAAATRMALLPGDANGDYVIDFNDVVQILGAGKYNTGAAATWAQGDFNGDGLANTTDLNLLTSGGHYNTGAYWTPPPDPAQPAADASATSSATPATSTPTSPTTTTTTTTTTAPPQPAPPSPAPVAAPSPVPPTPSRANPTTRPIPARQVVASHFSVKPLFPAKSKSRRNWLKGA